LTDARAKRDEAKKLMDQGIDPKAEKKGTSSQSKVTYSFEHIGYSWRAFHCKIQTSSRPAS
ncbi:integrase, partial [Xenorhabdus khoisanae]|nr:integrase [Xenorhabdus khoisanae]